MRITGGQAKGIPLKVNKKSNLRPATDFIRQSVFSSLGDLVIGATFLDLFAGTGAYGLEALSRGALGGVFIEKDRLSVRAIEENLKSVAKSMAIVPDHCQIHSADVFKTQIPGHCAYDLIFVDPPYELYGTHANFLRALPRRWLRMGQRSRVVFEAPGELQGFDIEGLSLIKRLGKNNKGPCALIYELAE